MSILPASMLEQLRGDLTGAGFNRTIQIQTRVADAWGTAANLSAVISSDQLVEEYKEDSSQRKKVRRITVRPLASPSLTVRLGDRVLYDGATFFVIEISGTDVLRWTAEFDTRLGVQGKDRFRSEGAT